MTRRKASFLQGLEAAKYLLPAEDHRLNHAALWAPSSVPGAAALAVQSGIVFGPGSPGDVTVVAGAGVNISPFHAAIQGTRSGVQGVFELTSDAVEFRAITAASSTQFRKGRLGIRVYDQLNGAAKDDWDLEVLYGGAAATAAAAVLPAVPADSTWFELRTFDVSNTGAITLSGITQRTVPRGGILPVVAGDVTPGAYVGQYRDHATRGLQRWNGAAWLQAAPAPTLYSDTGAALTAQAAPTAVRVHPARTIDPAALFGAGWGALVQVSATCGVNPRAGSGVWMLDLYRNGTRLIGEPRNVAAGGPFTQLTIPAHTEWVLAGTTAAFYTELSAPGVASTVTVDTFGDTRNNRAQYLVHPVAP